MADKLKFCCNYKESHNHDELFRFVNLTIKNIFDNAVQEISTLPDDFKSNQSRVFLRHLKFFKDHVALRIKTLPETAKIKDDHYRNLWIENGIIKDELKELTAFLEQQKIIHNNTIDQINLFNVKNLELIDKIEKKGYEDAELLTVKLERMQLTEYEQSESRQNDLQQICVISKNKSHSLNLHRHHVEKELLSKRFKIASQLTSLINRHDTEIENKNSLLFDLKTELNNLIDKIKNIDQEIKDQSVIFYSCEKEHEEARLKDLKIKIIELRKPRSAKIIQRWWRKIYPQLQLKKLLKKTKQIKKKSKKKRGKKV